MKRFHSLRPAFLGVAVSVCAAVAAAPASTAAGPVTRAPVTPGSRYLALGDSVTFGYVEPQVVPAPNYHNAASFLGYPELLGAELRLNIANAACAGETSSSLINPSAPSNGCENSPPPITTPLDHYRLSFPLHVHYSGSQLAFAVSYLRAHRNVRLVSLSIGANDVLLCLHTTSDACASKAEQSAVFRKVARNIHHILSTIRTMARYRGQLVILTLYSPVTSSFLTGLVSTLNRTMDGAAQPFGVEIADGFTEFKAAALHSGGDPCTAGLLTQLGHPGACGVHPSYAGQALLAQAVEKAIHIGGGSGT